MITQTIAKTIPELLKAIASGSNDPAEKGPVVVMIMLASGQIVAGSYTNDTPDITSSTDVLENTGELQPFVESLIATKTPFVTRTGSHDLVCSLKWTITEPIN